MYSFTQIIVERIFTKTSEALIPLNKTLEQREFGEIEENAIYYVAGYIIRKLIWKYEKTKGEDSKLFVNALQDMLGEDCNNVEATSTYNDYMKIWIKTQVVEDCNMFLMILLTKVIEVVMYLPAY